jgi:hypothetical protein
MTPLWSNEAWESFKTEARAMRGAGLHDEALRARLESAMKPLLAYGDREHQMWIREDVTRYLVACGFLPASTSL